MRSLLRFNIRRFGWLKRIAEGELNIGEKNNLGILGVVAYR
jgi:hypothetical protein